MLTLSQTSPGFYVSAVQVFSKTLWEKEKLLVTSNFSFSHSVFYPFEELSSIFINFWNCRRQSLSVWKSLIFVVWERVKEPDCILVLNISGNCTEPLSCSVLPQIYFADFVEQDQPAPMWSLIFLNILHCCIINPLPDDKF